jgi:hypothetical protein
MGLASFPTPAVTSWNPLKCSGSDLPANLTVLVKVLAIALLLTNHVRLLPDPWLSFIPPIDALPPLLFKRTLQTVFVVSALAIIFNRRIRIASLVLGAAMLLAVVSSKAYYGNNKTFCGLMLFLSGLYKPGGYPFLRWQLAVTYFGAGLNKLIDADWHSGVFFENWAVNRLHQPWYIALDALLPAMFLAKFMCWSTIVTELGIIPCILIPSLYDWAIIFNVLFQASLLLFTGTTFTVFFYSMTAASLAFVNWPTEPVAVMYDANRASANAAKRFFSGWDFDRRLLWVPAEGNLHFSVGSKVYCGFGALRMLLLLNPVTYLSIVAAMAACESFSFAPLVRRVIVAISLLLLMPPLAWVADKFFGDGDAQRVRGAEGVRVIDREKGALRS